MVAVPYVHSFTGKKEKKNNNNNNVYSLNRDRVARVVKPQTTFRQVIVHLKDKVDKQKKKGWSSVQNSKKPT